MTPEQRENAKAEIPRVFYAIFILLSTILWGWFLFRLYCLDSPFQIGSFLTSIGLTFDMLGIVFASKSVKFLGVTYNSQREGAAWEAENNKWLYAGLSLVLVGFFLQGVGSTFE